MGSTHKFICIYKLQHLRSISFLFILISSWTTQLRFMAEGRAIFRPAQYHSWEGNELLNGQIGSRPPRCERRCSSCRQCEAIQVPTNPQIKAGSNSNSPSMSSIDHARGDDSSNYKPMTWMCKCGDSIFNPWSYGSPVRFSFANNFWGHITSTRKRVKLLWNGLYGLVRGAQATPCITKIYIFCQWRMCS